jgi:hypothetical protein
VLYDTVLGVEPSKEVPEASPLPESSNVTEFVVIPPPVPPAMFTVTKSPAAETDETPEPVNRIPVAPAVT